MDILHYGYQRSELSPASVQQRCFAQLQNNIDNIVVTGPSNPPELGVAVRVLQTCLCCSMGLAKLVFMNVEASVLCFLDCPVYPQVFHHYLGYLLPF